MISLSRECTFLAAPFLDLGKVFGMAWAKHTQSTLGLTLNWLGKDRLHTTSLFELL